MSIPPHRPPVSVRHAFALAFDLAVRRDSRHSLLVPLLLRTPWLVAVAGLPRADEPMGMGLLIIAALALVGQSAVWLAVDAMLRFRARSVFNTPAGTPPAPIRECYARGVRRLPWLYLTEAARSFALLFGFGLFVIPAVVIAFRLSFTTEAVVLDEPHLTAAFRRSWRLAEGRFERWLELIVASVGLALGCSFVAAALSLIADALHLPGRAIGLLLATVLIVGLLPIIQYAWTFFYLRVVEAEQILAAGSGAPAPGPDPGGMAAANLG